MQHQVSLNSLADEEPIKEGEFRELGAPIHGSSLQRSSSSLQRGAVRRASSSPGIEVFQQALQQQSELHPRKGGVATNPQLLRSLSITRDSNGSLSVDLDRADGIRSDEVLRPLKRVPSTLRQSDAALRVSGTSAGVVHDAW